MDWGVEQEVSVTRVALRGKERLLAIVRDVTERRRTEDLLKQERSFSAAVLDTAGALVVVLDQGGRIVRFNRACESITGYLSGEGRGRPFWDIYLIPEEIASVKVVFDELHAGQFPNEHENYWLMKDGGLRTIAWWNTALLDHKGAVEYIVATGIDVTERRMAEQQLRAAHDELERRVEERTAALTLANDELQAQSEEITSEGGCQTDRHSSLQSEP